MNYFLPHRRKPYSAPVPTRNRSKAWHLLPTLIAVVLLTVSLSGVTPAAAAALATSCDARTNIAKLNEVKSQGGGATAKYVEVIVLGTGVSIDGWEIGYGDQGGGNPKYVVLGAGNCTINGTTTTDAPGGSYSYPTFITCPITAMNASWGEFILKTNTTHSPVTGVLDYLQYDSGSCPRTPTYWNPAGSSACIASPYCATFSPSSSDLGRSPDGTGSFVDSGTTTTQGTSNTSTAPAGQQMLRNFTFVPGSGTLCAGTDQSITLRALDITGAIKTNYAGTVLINRNQSGVYIGGSLTFVLANAGQQVITLNEVNGISYTLTAVDTAIPGTSSTSGAYTFSSASCAPASFEIVQVNAASNNSPLYTQRAGASFNLELRALDASRNLMAGYAGTVTLGLVDATGYNGSNCASLAAIGTASSTTMSAGDGGKKTVTVTTAKPARNVRVRASETTYGITSCSSDNFAIRPDYFQIAPGTSVASAPTSKLAAGSPFLLTATPVYWDGSAATALTSGNYDGTPSIDSSKILDHAGAAIAGGALADSDAIAGINFPAATLAGGGATTGTFRYSDVGTIALQVDAVIDAQFTAVDQVSGSLTAYGVTIDHGTSGDCTINSTSYAPSAGLLGCTVGSQSTTALGLFTVDHYEATLTLSGACNTGMANEFTYMDQDGLMLGLQLRAMSSASSVPLSRLTASYSRLPTVTLTGDNSGTGIPLTRISSPVLPALAWSAGSYGTATDTYRFDARNSIPVYVPPAAETGPYENFKLKLTVTDPDAALITALNGAPVTGAASVMSLATKLRYGRLAMSNAFGSEALPLSVPTTVQYYTAGSWVTNSDDGCTSIAVPASGSGLTLNLAAGGTSTASMANGTPSGSVTSGSGAFYQGLGRLVLTAPGSGKTGYVDINLAAPDWLLFSGIPNNNTARATFGIYNQLGNSKKIIDRREVR